MISDKSPRKEEQAENGEWPLKIDTWPCNDFQFNGVTCVLEKSHNGNSI